MVPAARPISRSRISIAARGRIPASSLSAMPASARRRISRRRISSTRRRPTRWRCRTRAKARRSPAWSAAKSAFTVTNVAAALPHITCGRLRALGVTSKMEAPQLPGVPPIAKTLPGFENTGWFGIVAPTGTPKEIIAQGLPRHEEGARGDDMRARLYAQGLAPVGNTPAEMAQGDEGRDARSGRRSCRSATSRSSEGRSARRSRRRRRSSTSGRSSCCRPTSSRASTRLAGARPTPARSACSAP